MTVNADALGMMAGGLVLGAVVIAAVAVISRIIPFYRRELAEDAGRRELPLDGLRGLAALGVVMCHAGMFYWSLQVGYWGPAGSKFLQAAGLGGVHLFFMLTGYLFWSKARRGNGKVPIIKMWKGRIYRLVPLYLLSLVMVLSVGIGTGALHLWDRSNVVPIIRMLGFGAISWHPLKGLDPLDVNGVVWTLWYEWRFYLALPFVAFLAIGRRTIWLGIALYIVLMFFGSYGFKTNIQPTLVFILGMLCPVLLDNEKLKAQLRTGKAAIAALALTSVLIALYQAPVFSPTYAAALYPVFVVTAAGNTFGGILVRPALRCLGAISYSLYLLHSVIFYAMMSVASDHGWTAHLSMPAYWVLATVIAVTVAIFCSATYRWVEFPFISQSHKRPVAETPVPQPELVAQ